MKLFAFMVTFTGEAVELADGRFWALTSAPACAFLQAVGADGSVEELDGFAPEEVSCRRDLEVSADGRLHQMGEIDFGADDAITFRARGELRASPEPQLRHGTAVFEVTGGRGRLAGARGYVTSNFLLSDSGELTDHHLALVFLEPPQRREER